MKRIKICICSSMDAGEFDDEYRYTTNKPMSIHWIRNSDGSYGTGRLHPDEIGGKVICQCGKYMKTQSNDLFPDEMVATCSCDDPKPEIFELATEQAKELPAEYLRLKNQMRIHWNWISHIEDYEEAYKFLKIWIDSDMNREPKSL